MRRLVLLLPIVLGVWLSHAAARAGLQIEGSVPTLQQGDAEKLSGIKSDEDARMFFLSQLRDSLSLTEISPDNRLTRSNKAKNSQSAPLSAIWIEDGVKLTAELATQQFTTRLTQAADSAEPSAIRLFLEHTRLQQQWLCSDPARSELSRAVKLATVVAAFSSPSDRVSTEETDRYNEFLDRSFPRLVEADNSWLQLAEREGLTGIRQRLMTFWEDPSTGSHAATELGKQTLADSYFSTRLKPVFLAHTLASAAKARLLAEQRAQGYWKKLKEGPDNNRELKGLVRLCGTWQWTIHNHQHHLDQKVAMVFAHPENEAFTGPRPSKTVVLGDVVYLRWEYPGGIQEDSLLFTGEGQRLEGSFINSSGAWGSITGKRTAPCTKQ